jgi:hypothetical protein
MDIHGYSPLEDPSKANVFMLVLSSMAQVWYGIRTSTTGSTEWAPPAGLMVELCGTSGC